MRFSATVEATCDTDQDISSRLGELDGVQETTGFAEYANETEDFTFHIESAVPTLRFNDESGLVLEVVITIDRKPTQEDEYLLYQYWQSQVEGGWGGNYEFDLPDGFEDFMVHFDEEPLEPVSDPNASAMEALVAGLPVTNTAELPNMTDEQLAALEKSLQWDGPLGDGPAYRTFNRISHAVETEIWGRRVASAREKSGIEAVSLDNLDAIDDLPDDVF